MTFAQALARIEMLSNSDNGNDHMEMHDLLSEHADSIVQLGKVAAEMRRHCIAYAEEAIDAFEAYDKLIKGDEG